MVAGDDGGQADVTWHGKTANGFALYWGPPVSLTAYCSMINTATTAMQSTQKSSQ